MELRTIINKREIELSRYKFSGAVPNGIKLGVNVRDTELYIPDDFGNWKLVTSNSGDGGGSGTLSRFGIEDNTGVQAREIQMAGFSLDIIAGDYYSGVDAATDYFQDASKISLYARADGSNFRTIEVAPTYSTINYSGTQKNIITSINGEEADDTGNIVISGGGSSSRFGIEDITGVQDRSIDMQAFDFVIDYAKNLQLFAENSDGSLNSTLQLDRDNARMLFYTNNDTTENNLIRLGEPHLQYERKVSGWSTPSIVRFPILAEGADQYLAISVNGNYADSAGNITISGGGGSTRFGIEDSTGVQDRAVDMETHSFYMTNLSEYNLSTGDSFGEGTTIYQEPTEVDLYAQQGSDNSQISLIPSDGISLNTTQSVVLQGTQGVSVTNASSVNQTFSTPAPGDYYIPVSVNGVNADSTGNVFLPAIGNYTNLRTYARTATGGGGSVTVAELLWISALTNQPLRVEVSGYWVGALASHTYTLSGNLQISTGGYGWNLPIDSGVPQSGTFKMIFTFNPESGGGNCYLTIEALVGRDDSSSGYNNIIFHSIDSNQYPAVSNMGVTQSVNVLPPSGLDLLNVTSIFSLLEPNAI